MGFMKKGGRALSVGAIRLFYGASKNAAEPPKDPKNILLLRTDRIGDLIVSTAAIRAIRKRFPEAHLAVVCSNKNLEVLANSPDIDEVHPLSRAGVFGLLLRLKKTPWDLAVDLNTAFSLTSGFLTLAVPAALRLSFEKEGGDFFYDVRLPAEEKSHRAREAMKLVSWLGGDDSDLSYRVYPSGNDAERAERALVKLGWKKGEDWIAVHPGNIKKYDNRWPAGRFSELLDKIAESGKRIVLLKGPDERPLINRVLAEMKAKPVVAPTLPLLVTACLLKRMKLVLCNSTSTLHLAAAVGAPTLSFLSGYSHACWRAQGTMHRALVGSSWGSCRDIPVEEGWKAFQEQIARSPG
ncbi:MAG: glycosyltransferase family 9 protein [Elusimicrobiota bacterium]